MISLSRGILPTKTYGSISILSSGYSPKFPSLSLSKSSKGSTK